MTANLPRDAAQRILGWLVTVGRREERRPDDVRAVVGAACGQADPADAARLQQPEERAPVSRATRSMPRIVHHARTPWRYPAVVGSGSPGPSAVLRYGTLSMTDSRTPMPRPGTVARMPSTTAKRNRVRFSRLPPYRPCAIARAQQLVTEVAVAVLDVDELEADGVGATRRHR